jgi:hypothetical protein
MIRSTRGSLSYCVGAVIGLFLISLNGPSGVFGADKDSAQPKHLKILKQIYDEVKELGRYPGEDFIRREFFIGNEDDDDTNKNQHIVVLIQAVDGQEKMRLQMTAMEPSKENPQVKYATTSKSVLCQVGPDAVTIQASDYDEPELEKLAAEILRAVLAKKKLLKLK